MKTILLTLCSLLVCMNLAAQTFTVTGKVTDANDKHPLSRVVITIKGTKSCTATDSRGVYSIQVQKGYRLIFTLSGYQTKEIAVTGATHNLALTPDEQKVKDIKKYTPPVVGDASVVTEEMVKMKDTDSGSSNVDASADSDIVIDERPVEHRVEQRIVEERMVIAYGTAKHRDVSANKMIASAHSDFDRMQNEEYKVYRENGFFDPAKEPLSTFSVNVDVASYGNLRRFINRGQLPSADAVRIEELINYFSYDYAKPTGKDPVKITADVAACPWNTQNRLVRIGLKARQIADEDMPASNLVFLIDVSGSMYGATRLELVKSSLKLLVNNLRDKDRVAIVVYAGSAGEVLPSTSGGDKQAIREALDRLTAGGSTAGGDGIRLAYNVARANFSKGGNNRVILCTDGDFNVGVSSPEGLEKLIEQERQSGVFLTVLGYGMGNYKDNRLQTLSAKGNGNYAYIDNLQEANKTLVQEFGGTMYTVAKDVKLQVEFNPTHVKAYRLVGYESRMLNKEDFNNDAIDAGEMGAGHTVTAFYEVVPASSNWSYPGSVDPLKYQYETPQPAKPQSLVSPEMLTVKLRYKAPDGNVSSKIEQPLIDRNAKVNDDFRFAAAVAMYGQLIKGSQYQSDATLDKVIELARQGLGDDPYGYRREFVRLAESTKGVIK